MMQEVVNSLYLLLSHLLLFVYWLLFTSLPIFSEFLDFHNKNLCVGEYLSWLLFVKHMESIIDYRHVTLPTQGKNAYKVLRYTNYVTVCK